MEKGYKVNTNAKLPKWKENQLKQMFWAKDMRKVSDNYRKNYDEIEWDSDK